MKSRINERGQTMIEVIMILGFLGAFSAGIVHLVSRMYDKYRVSRINQQIEEVKKSISNRYMAAGSFVGLTPSGLIKDGAVPADMVAGDNELRHAFMGNVSLHGYFNRYTVTFSNLPLEACVELAMIDWTMGDSSDLINLKINGHTYRWPAAPGAGARLLPLQMSDVSTECTGDDNEIMWNFQ